MKTKGVFRARAAALLLLVVAACAAPAAGAQRRVGTANIEGRVVDPGNRPVANARVYLLTDSYSPARNAVTDGAGRFRFRVAAGNYYVDVEPQGLPFERARERVEANASPFSQAAGETFFVDIRLQPLKNPDAAKVTGARPVLFVQEVPKDARAAYERGRKLLPDKPDEAYAELRRALEVFPDYYDALETLGAEYVKAGRHDEARPLLERALRVNPDGSGSHYALGVLLYGRGLYEEAAASFSTASRLNSKSPNAALYLGLALFRAKKAAEAEEALRRAYGLGATGIPDLYLGLATIYSSTHRNAEAAAQLELMLKEVANLKGEDRQRIRQKIEELRGK